MVRSSPPGRVVPSSNTFCLMRSTEEGTLGSAKKKDDLFFFLFNIHLTAFFVARRWGGEEALMVRFSVITPPVAPVGSRGRDRKLSPPSKPQGERLNHHSYTPNHFSLFFDALHLTPASLPSPNFFRFKTRATRQHARFVPGGINDVRHVFIPYLLITRRSTPL